MAEGWRMWAIPILFLLPLLSAAPLDIAGDIKKEDVKADNDGMHSHDENVTRGGKFFRHNRFDMGDMNISGSVAGDVVSIGHEVKIDVHGHTHDHHHNEADTVIECKEGIRVLFKSIDSNKNGLMDAKELLRVCHQNNIQVTKPLAVRILTLPDKTVGFNLSKFCDLLKDCPSTNSADIIYFLLQLFDKGSFDECQFKTCGELCQTGVCDGDGFCVDPLENPCEQHGCEGKSCGDLCLAGDIVGNCDIDGNCDFDIDRAFNSCDKQEAPKQEGESCGSCFCPPTYSAGECAEGLTCVTDEEIPDAPGICTRPGGREEPEEKKVVIPCGFNDDLLAPRLLPNGQKSPRDTSGVFQWKNNIVPYYFSNDDYSNEMRKAEDREFVRGVMDKFEEKTCFEFVEKSKTELRMQKIRNKLEVNEHVLEINIQDYPCTLGNEGVVFPVAGTTRLQLYLATHVTGKYPDGSKCRNEGLVIHELMHAFGVGHTHRRSDRDKFIQVILDNLKPNVYNQYDICKKCVLHKEIPYECGSIMHYGSHDNTEDFDKAVVVPLAKEKCKLPRKSLQVYDASAMDWQLINIIGECPKVNGQASPDVQSSPENYPEKLANVGLVLRGYDIMRGNPLPLKEILLDPGIRHKIFEATYHEDSKTPDHRYLQPDGVDILNCADSCSTTFKTDQFSGAKSYQQSLSNEVGFSLGGSYGAWGAKFSASAGFKEVSDKTSSESKIFTMSSATCCAYRAELRYNHPSLDKDFLRALEDLTEKYEEKIYLRFIAAYGTHFISRVTMGSKFVHLKEISKETVSTLQQNGFDIRTAAEVSAYFVTGSVDVSSTNDKSVVDSFSSEADTQNTYTIGVKSPEDGKAKTWIQKPLTNPAPIQLELMEIVDLLDLHKDIEVSAAVKDNLRKAMNDYCGVFKNARLVSTCSAPGPDLPIPTIKPADRLLKGQKLLGEEFLRSQNGEYDLVMQTDGNLVIYENFNNGRTATYATGTSSGAGSYLVFQADGNLVIYTTDGTVLWATNTPSADSLVMQNDGNLVLYAADNALWASNDDGVSWTPGASIDCWNECGWKGDFCPEVCGENGWCCRKDFAEDNCPDQARDVSTSGHHTCVIKPAQAAKPRTWTSWSNGNFNGYLNHVKECAEGTYVDQIRAREQDGYGIVNLSFECSDGQQHTMNGNFHGFWDSPLTCERGFTKLTGKEEGGHGIINMRAWCRGEETSQRANENDHGHWNGDKTCEANQQVVGFEAREQDGYGIINFRFLCA